MIDIQNQYTQLLPIQYFNKPKAFALVELLETEGNLILDLAQQVQQAFNIETAVGKQLDILGERVGLRRLTLNNKLLQLNYPPATDDQYRFFLKFKIITNNLTASISNFGNNFLALQEALNFVSNSQAIVKDNYNMSLTIDFDNTLEYNTIKIAIDLKLIPNPQAVAYSSFSYGYQQGYFGFSEDPFADGLGDVGYDYGGYIADLIV